MTLRSSCNGLPDCNPPNCLIGKLFGAFAAASIIFYFAEKLIFNIYDLTSQNTTSLVISSIVSSFLVITIFISWARRPQSAPGWQQNGSCVEKTCKDQRLTPKVLDRNVNALLYGLAIGLLIIVPSAISDFDSNNFNGAYILWGNMIRLVVFMVVAFVVRLILQMPATDPSPTQICIFPGWVIPYRTTSNDNPVKK